MERRRAGRSVLGECWSLAAGLDGVSRDRFGGFGLLSRGVPTALGEADLLFELRSKPINELPSGCKLPFGVRASVFQLLEGLSELFEGLDWITLGFWHVLFYTI